MVRVSDNIFVSQHLSVYIHSVLHISEKFLIYLISVFFSIFNPLEKYFTSCDFYYFQNLKKIQSSTSNVFLNSHCLYILHISLVTTEIKFLFSDIFNSNDLQTIEFRLSNAQKFTKAFNKLIIQLIHIIQVSCFVNSTLSLQRTI